MSVRILASVSLALVTGACAATGQTGMPAAAAPAAATEAPTPRYSARQFYENTSYGNAAESGLAFAPDGKHILVSHDASGVFNAYLLPLDGGAAKPLTASTGSAIFGASLFPQDGRLIYTGDQGGNELTHVYVREEDGSVRDLTPGDKVKADFGGWNPARDTFYTVTNERDPQSFDLYAHSATDYSRRLIYAAPTGFSIAGATDDGRWLALIKRTTSADSDIYLVDLRAAKPEPKLITQHEGSIAYGVYGFTPDSSRLVYGTNEHGEFNQAWTHDLATGARAPLVQADWDVTLVQFSPSGRYRVSAVNEDARTRLTILDTQSGKPVSVAGLPEGNIAAVRFSEDEARIAFAVTSDTSPADIYVADLAGGSARRLTKALNPAIDESALVAGQVARFKSWDGLEVPGILYRPKGASAANPAPAIVWVHGGPGGQSRRGYSDAIQHLVNHGYAVYAINNRGSSGYGKTFFHMDDRNHGEGDLKDVVAAKGFLQGMDWIADEGIAVMGGSYGGYMTAAALTFHPEVFDAGVNIFGVTNWVRTLKSIPAWWGAQRDALYDEMGDPATDEERHRAISPLFHAHRIVRPLLVVQGANDPRVLKVESDELVEAARKNGTPVEYVVFPDEGHGFLRKENRITASEAWLAFLDKHVKR